MSQKTFNGICALLFGVVGLMHACRVVRGWEIVIGGWSAPLFASWIGLVVAFYLCYAAFQLMRRT